MLIEPSRGASISASSFSKSWAVTNSNSSPASSEPSLSGGRACPSRMIATKTTSPGQFRSPIRAPTVGLLEGKVISTEVRGALVERQQSDKITDRDGLFHQRRHQPRCRDGDVDPQTSLNSHSFFG